MRQLPTGNLKYDPVTHTVPDDPEYMATLRRNARIPVQRVVEEIHVKKVRGKRSRKG
jgi:hypothetical protein